MDTLNGLVAHPLFVHLPAVLVPLAAIGVVVLAVRPGLLRTFGGVTAAVAGAGFVGTMLAASSGEALEERYEESGQALSETLQDHMAAGDRAQGIVAVFFVATLVWVVAAWWRRRVGEERAAAVVRRPRIVFAALAVAAVLTGVVATVTVIDTGHSGATSVWENAAP